MLFFNRNVLAEEEIIPGPIVLTANVFIRNGEEIVYDGVVNLPEEGVVSILSSDGENHEINSRSVLAILYLISQEAEPPFLISNLQYYSSLDAFYLKCITPNSGAELCDNWQYIIDSATPPTGIDKTILIGGESIGLYFGTSHRLILDKNTILEGESITVNSEKYNYIDNTWGILPGVNIDVTIPNEADPWNPTLISETAVDENGIAIIILTTAGTYTFGIKEDYSFPSYQVIVNKSSGGGSGGGNGGGDSSEVKEFSLIDALSFLLANQEDDGSFGDDLYTDWVAIGIARIENDSDELKNKIYDYLKNNTMESSIVTDNERHAMALMALDINPYTGTEINYIGKIISSFDGTQLGDDSLYNDDIFGLIVLQKAGYTIDDEIIQKIISYIISKQSPDGSWGSIDMTSAAIMALSELNSIEGVSESITLAENYLIELQNEDGGFGNSFSTSWAIQALSLNNSFETEIQKATEYLASLQQQDGGLGEDTEIENRIWETAYAIPAVSLLSWNDILEPFEKEETESTNNNGSSSNDMIDEDLPEEIIEIPEPAIIEPEIVIIQREEIKEIPPKIVKKEIITKTGVKTETLETEKVAPNVLGASAYQSTQNTDNQTFVSVLKKIIEEIKSSFVWLWINWIF